MGPGKEGQALADALAKHGPIFVQHRGLLIWEEEYSGDWSCHESVKVDPHASDLAALSWNPSAGPRNHFSNPSILS